MDKILIQQIIVDTIIGTQDHERVQKQPIIIDLAIAVDITKAAASDKLADTSDYADLCQRVKNFIAHSQFYLLETLTEKIAQLILTEFKAKGVRVKATKPQALAEKVSIVIKRGDI